MYVLLDLRSLFDAWSYYLLQQKLARLAIGDDDMAPKKSWLDSLAMRVMAPKKIIFKFPLPMDGMPQYYSPSFHPSTHIAPSVNPLRISSPKGRALEYECEWVAMCRSRPCHSPASEPSSAKNHSNLCSLDLRTMMGHLGKALILFNGPRHGEHRLRVQLRRGLRDWGDFYTCPEFIGRSYKLPQPCKVAFIDRVEVMDANPEEMPLVDGQDRKYWRFCEDRRISCDRRRFCESRRADFAACATEFGDALVGWPWGDDAEKIELRLRAARGRNACRL